MCFALDVSVVCIVCTVLVCVLGVVCIVHMVLQLLVGDTVWLWR